MNHAKSSGVDGPLFIAEPFDLTIQLDDGAGEAECKGRYEWELRRGCHVQVLAAGYDLVSGLEHLGRFKAILMSSNRENVGNVAVEWVAHGGAAALVTIQLHALYTVANWMECVFPYCSVFSL